MTTILTPTASDITPLLNLRLKVTIAASGAGATLIAERTVEASLWSFDTITGFLVLSSLDPPLSSSSSSSSTATTPIPNPSSDATSASPAPSAKRSYHFVKSNQIKSVVVLSPVPDASLIELEAALKQISFVDVEVRVEKAVKEEIKQRARIGEGVSAEAQELFDNLARTLPVRWSKEEIIVMDEVIISPPYGAANVKGAKGTGERVERVKKVVNDSEERIDKLDPASLEMNSEPRIFYADPTTIRNGLCSCGSRVTVSVRCTQMGGAGEEECL